METTVFYLLMSQKVINSRQKKFQIKPYPLCLGNIWKDFAANKTKKKQKKTGLNGYVYDFPADYNVIDNSNVINIHKYLIKKRNIK